jgi:hypothetical protein
MRGWLIREASERQLCVRVLAGCRAELVLIMVEVCLLDKTGEGW